MGIMPIRLHYRVRVLNA